MDSVGDIFRDYLHQARTNEVQNATAIGGELKKDGMTLAQVREMLYADGFDCDIIKESLKEVFPQKNK